MQGGGGAGGRGRFTCVDGEVDATVYGVVVLVGRRWLTGEFHPPPGRFFVRVFDERDVGSGVVYPKLRMCHEVVDGRAGIGFFQAFVQGATESIHDTDLGKRKRAQQMISGEV